MVVETKLHIPRPLPERAPRPELLRALVEADSAKLVLVAAPAGSGKTTLLGSWHAHPQEERPFAWVSLDDQDNDQVRFWSCMLAALRTVEPDFGGEVLAALRAPGPDVGRLALPLIVNGLVALPRRIVLVLDDFHVIQNPDVQRSVEFVLEHLPPTTQLAVASRTDPPLPIARLRARGELIEVRTADLRLTEGQASALLNESLGLSLSREQVAQLQARTEGWAAALQLVGLSLRGRDDPRAYITSFEGDDRHVVDYVASEVLERQTPEIRRFLLHTSILERLSSSLCDAVTDTNDSAQRLVELERANLFLLPLDGRRAWYRYHQLFQELLRHELQLAEPEQVATLHRRAYGWYRAEGFIPEAIRHATAAGDVECAAELIAANWLAYVNRGELETVETWTSALPPGAAQADPRLCLARAWMLLVLGRPEEVESAVQEAEKGTLPGPMQDGSRSVEASAAMVRTSARLLTGDVAGASETAALAAKLEPDPDAPWRPIVTNAQGMTAYWSGRSEEAVGAFRETVRAAVVVGNHTAHIYALGYLAVIAAERGDGEEADELVRAALALADRQDLREHWVTTMAHFAAAETARRGDEAAAAESALARGFELAERGRLRLDAAFGLVALARLRRESGRMDEARELLRGARARVADCPAPGILTNLLDEAERRIRPRRPARATSGGEPLSEREQGVLQLLPTDLSQREIARELYVSLNTVKSHVRSIFRKLDANDRASAVARARELDLL